MEVKSEPKHHITLFCKLLNEILSKVKGMQD